MKSFVLSGVAAFALSMTAAFAAPTIGEPAPAFSAIDTAGKTRSLAELKGKTSGLALRVMSARRSCHG